MIRALERVVLFFVWSVVVFGGGVYLGERRVVHEWTDNQYRLVERRLREVFCEQAVGHGLLKRCYPQIPETVHYEKGL